MCLFTKEFLFEVHTIYIQCDGYIEPSDFQALSVHFSSVCFFFFLSLVFIFQFAFVPVCSCSCVAFRNYICIHQWKWLRCYRRRRRRCRHRFGNLVVSIWPQNSTPYFELRSLNSGVGYNVFLIAQNAKGRSNSTVRQVFTLNNPEKQTDTSSLLASTPSLASLKTFVPFLLFGCAGAIALTAIIVGFIIRKRANRSNNSTNDALADQSTGGSSDRGETASYALSTQRTLQSSQEVARDLCADESMEKNPDIIPQGKFLDYIIFSHFISLIYMYIYIVIECV